MNKDIEKCALCSSVMKCITVHDFMMDKDKGKIDWQLCPNHALIWMMRCLEPADVLKIRSLAGGVTFHTHEDFYGKEGDDILESLRKELKEVKRQLKLASTFHENCVKGSPEYKSQLRMYEGYREGLRVIGYNMSMDNSERISFAQKLIEI